MTKYPEYIEAGVSVSSLIKLARGGTFEKKQNTKDVWVVTGFLADFSIGEPGTTVPPGTLRLASAEREFSLDEACDTLTAYFDPERLSATPNSFVVAALIVVLKAALSKINPALAAAIISIVTELLASQS